MDKKGASKHREHNPILQWTCADPPGLKNTSMNISVRWKGALTGRGESFKPSEVLNLVKCLGDCSQGSTKQAYAYVPCLWIFESLTDKPFAEGALIKNNNPQTSNIENPQCRLGELRRSSQRRERKDIRMDAGKRRRGLRPRVRNEKIESQDESSRLTDNMINE